MESVISRRESKRLYLAQGVEAFDHSIEHDDQMLPGIKVLHIPFTTVFTAEFENFCLVKQKNQLTIHRLSDKMCTFVHVIDVLSQKQR